MNVGKERVGGIVMAGVGKSVRASKCVGAVCLRQTVCVWESVCVRKSKN